MRVAFLAALASPRSRRSRIAFSTSPAASPSAFWQSSRPAPVFSRSSLTDSSAIALARLRLDHVAQVRRAARAVVGAPGLVPGAALALLVEVAALDHPLGDRGAEETDGA